MQQDIGDHALLADGRTAALVDADGNVAWMCWPRVDSTPLLYSLLDDRSGGCFTVRPSSSEARVASRRYRSRSLVVETEWHVGSARLLVDDVLTWSGPPRLLRRLRSSGGSVEVEARFSAGRWDGTDASSEARGTHVVVRAGQRSLSVTAPADWHPGDGALVSRHMVAPDAPVFVTLGDADDDSDRAHETAFAATVAAWTRMFPARGRLQLSGLAISSLDESQLHALLDTTTAVLIGLRQRGGGIVAAPTTSLPQWPGSARNWDYRYCWFRDASIAGLAMIRLGLVQLASELGDFLGSAIHDSGPRAVVRVDGSAPPLETEVSEPSGYRGAQPVRIGNAAAEQLQIDVPGEVIEFARALATCDALPERLARATAVLADWLVEHWTEADHGIWEIRGRPRRYTHSRVMASVGLFSASELVDLGLVGGDAPLWRRTAAYIREGVLRSARGPMQLHDQGGGADAALAMVPIAGFLPADDAVARSTMSFITNRLMRSGLMDRYEGQPDELHDPCAPFVFPTFWAATAGQMCNGDGGRCFSAAVQAHGSLGLWGEVATPDDRRPLGNYPQVQSHAAFALAATAG